MKAGVSLPACASRILVALVAWLALAAGASQAAPVPADTAYHLPGTEAWDMASPAGEAYRIFVSRPAGEPPAGGYPVLYVLDGNAFFAGFAETRRLYEWAGTSAPEGARVGKALVVGVAYPGEGPYDFERRARDFTSAFDTATLQIPRDPAGIHSGGREAFREFLLGPLRAEIARRHPVNPKRQALFGHSLGGLFALHVLYTAPEAFDAVIAASPSLWWNDQEILAEERAFAARLANGSYSRPGGNRLLLVVGGLEGRAASLWDAEAMAERMRPLSAHGLRFRFQRYEAESHITVPSRAVTDTLRFAFAWP